MPSPRDWRDVFIYQLLIDRFDDTKDHALYDPKTAMLFGDAKTSVSEILSEVQAL